MHRGIVLPYGVDCHHVDWQAAVEGLEFDVVDIHLCGGGELEGHGVARAGIGGEGHHVFLPAVMVEGEGLQHLEAVDVKGVVHDAHLQGHCGVGGAAEDAVTFETQPRGAQAVDRWQVEPPVMVGAECHVGTPFQGRHVFHHDIVGVFPAAVPESGIAVGTTFEVFGQRQLAVGNRGAGSGELHTMPLAAVLTTVGSYVEPVLVVGREAMEVAGVAAVEQQVVARGAGREVDGIELYAHIGVSHLVGRPAQQGRVVAHSAHGDRGGTRAGRHRTVPGDHRAAIGQTDRIDAGSDHPVVARAIGGLCCGDDYRVPRAAQGHMVHLGLVVAGEIFVLPRGGSVDEHEVEQRVVRHPVVHRTVDGADVAVGMQPQLEVEVVLRGFGRRDGVHRIVLHMLPLDDQHLVAVVVRHDLPPTARRTLRHLPVEEHERRNDGR